MSADSARLPEHNRQGGEGRGAINADNSRLSVPAPRTQLPWALPDGDRDVLTRLADVLCGPHAEVPPPSSLDAFPGFLEIALATRSDCYELLLTLAQEAADDPSERWLRALADDRPDDFQKLSTVLAGAYLMVPEIKQAVGYPGQRREIPGLEEAVDQIGDGILDPVLERGHFFVATPGVQ